MSKDTKKVESSGFAIRFDFERTSQNLTFMDLMMANVALRDPHSITGLIAVYGLLAASLYNEDTKEYVDFHEAKDFLASCDLLELAPFMAAWNKQSREARFRFPDPPPPQKKEGSK